VYLDSEPFPRALCRAEKEAKETHSNLLLIKFAFSHLFQITYVERKLTVRHYMKNFMKLYSRIVLYLNFAIDYSESTLTCRICEAAKLKTYKYTSKL